MRRVLDSAVTTGRALREDAKTFFSRRDYVVFVSLTLGLAQFLSNGPQIQEYLASLLTSNATTIYASANKELFAPFPTLGEWIFHGFHWLFISMAVVTLFCSIRKDDYKSILFATSVASFFTLTAVDFIYALLGASLTINSLFENIVFNAIGAPVIAAFVMLCLFLLDTISEGLAHAKFIKRFCAVSIPLFVGILCSAAVNIVLAVFYKPVPISVEAHLSPRVSGWINSSKAESEYDDSPDDDSWENFDFLRGERGVSTITWQSMRKSLKENWKSSGDRFDVKLELYSGCFDFPALRPLQAKASPISFENVKQLQVWFDDGTARFVLPDVRLEEGYLGDSVSLSSNGHVPYWISSEKAGGTREITQGVHGNSILNFMSRNHPVTAYLGANLFASDEDHGATRKERKLSIEVDVVLYEIWISPPYFADPLGPLICESVDFPGIFYAGASRLETSAINVGLVFSAIPVRENDMFSRKPTGSSLKLGAAGADGLEGFLSSDMSSIKNPMAGVDLGTASYLSFNGDVSGLFLDGERVEASSSDTYSILSGRLRGTRTFDDKVKFSGPAFVLYKDEKRLNRTKWEKMDSGWKATLVTVLTGLFSAFLYVVKKAGDGSRLKAISFQ